MTNALTTTQGGQPAWLAIVPENLRDALATQLATQPKDTAAKLLRASRLAGDDMLAACQTADEVVELLRMLAEADMTDDQANYIPAVYTINHKTQRFQDDAGDTLKAQFRAVIIHFQPTRGFFIENRKLPLCSAIGNLVNGMTTDNAKEDWEKYQLFTGIPLDWQAKNCAECHFNEFGTDPKTLAGKACKEKYRLFLALVDGTGNLTGEGVMMNVPTTSMKNWDTYVSHLKRHKTETGKLQPLTTLQVVTEFSLEKAVGQSQEYAKILFKGFRPLTPAEFRQVYEIRQQIVKVADKLGVEVGESYDQAAPESAGPAGDTSAGSPDGNIPEEARSSAGVGF